MSMPSSRASGGRQTDDAAVAQRPLQGPALLGEITAPYAAMAPSSSGATSARDAGRSRPGPQPRARPRERHGLHPAAHEVREEVGRLGCRGAAHRCLPGGVLAPPAGRKRCPAALLAPTARRSSPHGASRRALYCGPGSPIRRSAWSPGSRTVAEASTKVGASRSGHNPPQPSQQRREARAEDAAVDVALVDDDVAQGAQEGRPALVLREQRVVHEVGVGQHELGVLTDRPTLSCGVSPS